MIHHAVQFGVGRQSALSPDQLGAARRKEEHVALAQQLVRPGRIQDGATVHLLRDLEGDAGREVGLDGAGDDVHGRTLRGQDHVDADRAR